MNENKTLAIYFKNGSTAYFEKVENFKYDNVHDITIEFDYFGIRSQVKRHAVFNFDVIAGFALEEENDE